jgi:hypothetical protein
MDILRLNKPFISEIVVVDGPRKQSVELFSALDLLYDEQSSIVREFFESQVRPAFPEWKYSYRFAQWEDEEVQRQAGYDACTNDLVFIADGDMLVKLNPENIDRFAQDPRRGVGMVQVWNMVSSNIFFSGSNDTVTASKPIFQPVAVNRKVIKDARTFFDHLWIVGVKQRPITENLIFPDSLGEAHHYTIGRTHISMMIKYAFYLTVPQNYQQFIANTNFINRAIASREKFGIPIVRNIFLRYILESGTCLSSHYLHPTPDNVQKMFPSIVKGEPFPGFSLPYGQKLLCRFTFLSGHRYYATTEEDQIKLRVPIMNNIESYISLNRMQSLREKVCLKMENVTYCRARVLLLELNQKATEIRVVDAVNDSLSVFRIPLQNGTIDETKFVRSVLAISCTVKNFDVDIGAIGWYQETSCD